VRAFKDQLFFFKRAAKRQFGGHQFQTGPVFFIQTAPLAMASLIRLFESPVWLARNSQAVAGSPLTTVFVRENLCMVSGS